MLKDSHTFSGFSVDDIKKAYLFYTEKLGLDVKDTGMGLELQVKGSSGIFVYEKHDHVPATFTILNFVVEDIEATVDDLVSNGVVFEHFDTLPAPLDERSILRGKSVQQGPDIAWFKDPAGNIFSVLCN